MWTLPPGGLAPELRPTRRKIRLPRNIRAAIGHRKLPVGQSFQDLFQLQRRGRRMWLVRLAGFSWGVGLDQAAAVVGCADCGYYVAGVVGDGDQGELGGADVGSG